MLVLWPQRLDIGCCCRRKESEGKGRVSSFAACHVRLALSFLILVTTLGLGIVAA